MEEETDDLLKRTLQKQLSNVYSPMIESQVAVARAAKFTRGLDILIEGLEAQANELKSVREEINGREAKKAAEPVAASTARASIAPDDPFAPEGPPIGVPEQTADIDYSIYLTAEEIRGRYIPNASLLTIKKKMSDARLDGVVGDQPKNPGIVIGRGVRGQPYRFKATPENLMTYFGVSQDNSAIPQTAEAPATEAASSEAAASPLEETAVSPIPTIDEERLAEERRAKNEIVISYRTKFEQRGILPKGKSFNILRDMGYFNDESMETIESSYGSFERAMDGWEFANMNRILNGTGISIESFMKRYAPVLANEGLVRDLGIIAPVKEQGEFYVVAKGSEKAVRRRVERLARELGR